ncbi:hypothetical protein, partial [Staphylococcus warneri]|uniref:hypothetical protein n=1 Tax=Staphylococcus warneri TaxID=1292 RepID=UPI001C943109
KEIGKNRVIKGLNICKKVRRNGGGVGNRVKVFVGGVLGVGNCVICLLKNRFGIRKGVGKGGIR